jgi:hypothetical protein
VEIVPLPEAMDGLIDYYRRISGEHPDWDDYRRAMWNSDVCPSGCQSTTSAPTTPGSRKLKPGKAS